MTKKFMALFLCAIMLISLVPSSVLAAEENAASAQELAEDLKALGVFKGVSETDFALGRAPTRVEALVMLIRVLGKENDALSKGGRHPFSDVPDWAKSYVGYAYENGLTNGISKTMFGSASEASSSMYITFVLRALGYSDKTGDFSWDNPFTLAEKTGIMKGNPNTSSFMRGDVVLVSYAALEAEVKGTGKTLADKLIEAGVFTEEKYNENHKADAFGKKETKDLTAELAKWIVKNKNSELSGEDSYAVEEETEGGKLFFSVIYSKEDDVLTLYSSLEFAGGSLAVATIDLVPGEDKVFTRYMYSISGTSNEVPYGDATLKKSEFKKGMLVKFSNKENLGADEKRHMEMAGEIYCLILSYFGEFAKNHLAKTGITGAGDLGFYNF